MNLEEITESYINPDIKLPGLNPDLNPENGNEITISVNMNQEQIEGMRNFGVDPESIVNNAIYNEKYSMLGKKISEKAFEGKYRRIKTNKFNRLDDSKDLNKEFLDLLKKQTSTGYGFIICNVKIGNVIQTFGSDFEMESLESQIQSRGILYKIGSIKEYSVWVDPYLRWDDDRISFVSNNFYNYDKNESVAIIAEGTMAPKIVVKYKSIFKKAQSEIIQIENLKI